MGTVSTLVLDFLIIYYFYGNLYITFVILNIKFRFANIKWSMYQNTVKFQIMTSLVDKIYTNRQTSTEY